MVARSSFKLRSRSTYRSRYRRRLYLDHVFLLMICGMPGSMWGQAKFCDPRTPACPSDWSMATRDDGTIYCLIIFEALQSESDAIQTCHTRGSSLVSFLTEKEYRQAMDLFRLRDSQGPVWTSLNKRRGSFRWLRGKLDFHEWLPGEPERSSTQLCVTFTIYGWQPTDCYHKHAVMCERKHVYSDFRHQAKLIMGETNRDPRRPNQAYRFVEIRGNCTLLHKEDEVAAVSIDPSPKPVINLHIIERKVKEVPHQSLIKKETTTKFSLKVLDSLDQKYIICFPVVLKAPEPNHKQCRRYPSCCAISGPFKVVKAPETPTITIRWSHPPNLLHLGKRLQATCTGLVIADTGTLFWWKVTKGQKVRLTDGDNGVKINKRVHNGTSTTNITISGLKRNDNGMKLECTVHDGYCPPQSSVCRKSKPIRLVEPPKPPVLTIKYDRPQDFSMYEGNTLVAECSAFVGLASSLSWVRVKHFTHTLIRTGRKNAPSGSGGGSSDTGGKGGGEIQTTTVETKYHDKKGTNVTSVLRVTNLGMDDHETEVICFSGEVDSMRSCPPSNTLCVKSQPLAIAKRPRPPQMRVNFAEPPSEIYEGTDLEASCNAYVGTKGRLVWAIHINTSIFTASVQELGIWIATVSLGIKREDRSSMLKISKISSDFNGMTISCFSYDITRYPDRYMRCSESDKLCLTTVPIHVTFKSDWHFHFGRDKIHKYMLLGALWFLVVLVVHICVWVRNSECFDMDLADDPYLDEDNVFHVFSPESSSEDTSTQDMTASTVTGSSRTMGSSVDSTPSPKSFPLK